MRMEKEVVQITAGHTVYTDDGVRIRGSERCLIFVNLNSKFKDMGRMLRSESRKQYRLNWKHVFVTYSSEEISY